MVLSSPHDQANAYMELENYTEAKSCFDMVYSVDQVCNCHVIGIKIDPLSPDTHILCRSSV